MKIYYINHSSFLIEFDDKALLFDYYDGVIPNLSKDKPIYIMASHSHEDHYSNKIFEIYLFNNKKYILSDDIKSKKENVIFVKANNEYEVDDLKIKTLRSTDEGVAFLVKCNDKVIFHAGDLNWWHWEGYPPRYNDLAEICYKNEINKLINEKIDVAFIPLDDRQEKAYYYGIDYVMETLNIKKCYPMHMWNHYEIIDRLKKEKFAFNYKDKIVNKEFYMI